MNNKGADQTARKHRLVYACVVRKPPKTDFLASTHLISDSSGTRGSHWLSGGVLSTCNLSLTKGTALCPRARHFIPCLVPEQPRKTGKRPEMTEKLLTGM